jgi:hypothetical protein
MTSLTEQVAQSKFALGHAGSLGSRRARGWDAHEQNVEGIDGRIRPAGCVRRERQLTRPARRPDACTPSAVRRSALGHAVVAASRASCTTAATATAGVAAFVAAIALTLLAALAARSASQTSAAWLARRAPGPQTVPSPTGLCAGAPAGWPPNSVRTTQLLGTRAGGLPCDAEAGPCQACSRHSSCALTTGLLLVLRAGVPAPSKAFGEDGERAAR